MSAEVPFVLWTSDKYKKIINKITQISKSLDNKYIRRFAIYLNRFKLYTMGEFYFGKKCSKYRFQRKRKIS